MTRTSIEEAIEVLEVSASNIRSLGPAGFIPFPYRDWLAHIEKTAKGLRDGGECICPKCGLRHGTKHTKGDF